MEALKTYAEFSISGTGVHIWARAPGLVYDKERYYFNNRRYGLEVYPAGVTTKFIVTTGNAINDYDINECTNALKDILEKYMVRPTADKPKVDSLLQVLRSGLHSFPHRNENFRVLRPYP